MTEVLVRHHATFHAMVESKMAAVGHVENRPAVLIRGWHNTRFYLKDLKNIIIIKKIIIIIIIIPGV